MPVLNWIGKDKVVNHDKDLPFRVLKPNPKLSVETSSENLLIEGDNLEALKSLMPFYYNKVKCIYIDPPYNTGSENWIYNDKVNAPQIKEWINKVVGKEDEDLCRHDKWLCMMYPRLKLLHQLLSQDGAIFVSIDDNEQHNLRKIMDEIFGENNFINNIIWQKKYTRANDARWFSDNHDFLVLYAKNKELWRPNKLPRTEMMDKRYTNPDNDPRGPWKATPLHAKSGNRREQVEFNNGTKWTPPNGTYNRYSAKFLEAAEKEERIYFGARIPVLKKYLSDMGKIVPLTIWPYDEAGHNDEAKKDIKAIFKDDTIFDTPKPVRLIDRILELATDKDSIVLDSFAGSGTTGHAVLEKNKQDGGNRKFILVELEEEVSKKITFKRLKNVIEGYEEAKYPNGTGQGFNYLDLNGLLYDNSGFINPDAQYEDLAAYIYFTETKNYLDLSCIENPFIGSQGSTNFFLFFEGKGNNMLDESTLKKTGKEKGAKVIFADKCLLDTEELEKQGITFKQIPYQLKKY